MGNHSNQPRLRRRHVHCLNSIEPLTTISSHLTEAASQVDAIRQAAENNPIGKFQLVFGEILESLFIEKMDLNEELFARYMNDPVFKSVAAEWLGQQVYSKIPKTVPYARKAAPLAGA